MYQAKYEPDTISCVSRTYSKEGWPVKAQYHREEEGGDHGIEQVVDEDVKLCH
jgi:hypothetical protein